MVTLCIQQHSDFIKGDHTKVCFSKQIPTNYLCWQKYQGQPHTAACWKRLYQNTVLLSTLDVDNPDHVSGLFYEHDLILIPAWISKHMPGEVCDEIIYPFPKLQRMYRWSLGISNIIPHFIMDKGYYYLSRKGLIYLMFQILKIFNQFSLIRKYFFRKIDEILHEWSIASSSCGVLSKMMTWSITHEHLPGTKYLVVTECITIMFYSLHSYWW